MAGKFQPPPIQGQQFLDSASGAPSFPWQKWFDLIPPALTSPALSGTVPATVDANGMQGQIATDGDFLYICVATNSWKRAALSAF